MATDSHDPPVSEDPQDQPRKKSRRAGQACDRCRSRKIKVPFSVSRFLIAGFLHQNTAF